MSSFILLVGIRTMINLARRPSLRILIRPYRDYFVKEETDTLRGRYAKVLYPYCIETKNADAATISQEVTYQIYVTAQEEISTVLLQWHLGMGGRRGQISILTSE